MSVPLFVAFGAGVLSFVSPCVLTLVPVYLASLSGPQALQQKKGIRVPVLLHSASFVVSFSIVFIVLGALAGMAGLVINLRSNLIHQISGGLLVLFGLFMLASIKISWLNYEKHLNPSIGATSSYLRSLLIGMIFAVAWTPCVGPVLGSILTLAMDSATAARGASLLSVYSLGMGLPFLAMGLLVDSLAPLIKRIKHYSTALTIFSGLVLIVIGVAILTTALTACSWFPSDSVDMKSSDGLENQITKLLPQGAMLRDFATIPSTQKVLVISIEDPVIDPQLAPDDLWSCPREVNGQAINGTYHLALFEQGAFINDIVMPSDEDGMIFRDQGIVYRHTKEAIYQRFGGPKPLDDAEAQQFAEVKLLRLVDLNGDGLPYEFQLEVYLAGCGHVQVLTAGYSAKQQRAVIYPIIEGGGQTPSYWHDNFYPDEKGTVHWRFECWDHANDIDAQKTFEFDPGKEAYVLTSHSETACEW